MNGYVVVPLVSCIASAMLAAAVLARDSQQHANRLAALLVGGVAFWAGLDVLWTTAEDPAVVRRLVTLSSLGWGALGPLSLHLFLEITGDPAPRTRRLLPWLYGMAGLFVALDLGTGWIHDSVTRQPWGWSYSFTSLYLAFYVLTVACIAAALRVLYRTYRHSPSRAEREQMGLLLAGVSMPLAVASLTDGLLPLFDVHVPRLGTASFVVLAAIIAWSFSRYTYPLVAPGIFGKEILESLRDGVALLRLDGRIRTCNGAMARLAGAPVASLAERPAWELIPALPASLREEVDELECELHSHAGQRLPISVSTTFLHGREDQPSGIVLCVRDLRELVGLRNRLVISGRLAAVGELAAGIAHEINNPVAYVRSNLTQLREGWETLLKRLEATRTQTREDPLVVDGLAMIDESLEGVDRAAAIVRDIKGFSHTGRAVRERVDVNELLDTVLRVAAPQLRYRARIETIYADVPRVAGAPQELKQVFLNLILNAAQAIEEGGRLRISTVAVVSDVYVVVEDDGCGMSSELMARIFDPFFTTKDVGEGTGLGLAISHEIVRRHGGEIGVESEPNRGTLVRVRLPAAEPAE